MSKNPYTNPLCTTSPPREWCMSASDSRGFCAYEAQIIKVSPRLVGGYIDIEWLHDVPEGFSAITRVVNAKFDCGFFYTSRLNDNAAVVAGEPYVIGTGTYINGFVNNPWMVCCSKDKVIILHDVSKGVVQDAFTFIGMINNRIDQYVDKVGNRDLYYHDSNAPPTPGYEDYMRYGDFPTSYDNRYDDEYYRHKYILYRDGYIYQVRDYQNKVSAMVLESRDPTGGPVNAGSPVYTLEFSIVVTPEPYSPKIMKHPAFTFYCDYDTGHMIAIYKFSYLAYFSSSSSVIVPKTSIGYRLGQPRHWGKFYENGNDYGSFTQRGSVAPTDRFETEYINPFVNLGDIYNIEIYEQVSGNKYQYYKHILNRDPVTGDRDGYGDTITYNAYGSASGTSYAQMAQAQDSTSYDWRLCATGLTEMSYAYSLRRNTSGTSEYTKAVGSMLCCGSPTYGVLATGVGASNTKSNYSLVREYAYIHDRQYCENDCTVTGTWYCYNCEVRREWGISGEIATYSYDHTCSDEATYTFLGDAIGTISSSITVTSTYIRTTSYTPGVLVIRGTTLSSGTTVESGNTVASLQESAFYVFAMNPALKFIAWIEVSADVDYTYTNLSSYDISEILVNYAIKIMVDGVVTTMQEGTIVGSTSDITLWSSAWIHQWGGEVTLAGGDTRPATTNSTGEHPFYLACESGIDPSDPDLNIWDPLDSIENQAPLSTETPDLADILNYPADLSGAASISAYSSQSSGYARGGDEYAVTTSPTITVSGFIDFEAILATVGITAHDQVNDIWRIPYAESSVGAPYPSMRTSSNNVMVDVFIPVFDNEATPTASVMKHFFFINGVLKTPDGLTDEERDNLDFFDTTLI